MRKCRDVEVVHKAAREAVAYARYGQGPVLLVCDTERLTGHYIGDAQVYRDKDELRRLRETRDPVRNLRERLEVDDEEWEQMDSQARRLVAEAVAFAKAGTDPKPEDALQNIYAESGRNEP